jgi:hypothetical protein
MYRNNKRKKLIKLAVIMLAFVVSVTFTPLLGDDSYAASSKSGKKYDEKVKYIQKDSKGNEKELDPEIFTDKGKVLNADELEDLGINISTEPNVPASGENDISGNPEGISDDKIIEPGKGDQGVPGSELSKDTELDLAELFGIAPTEDAAPTEPDAEVEAPEDGDDEAAHEGQDEETTTPQDAVVNAEDVITTSSFKVAESVSAQATTAPMPDKMYSFNSSTGKVSLMAHFTDGSRFGDVYVDNNRVANLYSSTINLSIDMKKYSVGYHKIAVDCYTSAGQYVGQFVRSNVPTYIYDKPNYTGRFEVYSNYFTYWPYSNMWTNTAHDLYMDYGGVRSGYMRSNPIQLYQSQAYNFGGLTPSTDYPTYIYYGKWVGKEFFKGPSVYTGTYRTGIAQLPKVKSVKVKATKVKKRKAGVYGWYTGYYFGSVKYYTYKIKVTVKFKKKPGLNGLYINGAWKPGNKKKYTLTLGPYANYSKPRGKKFNVYLYSAVAPGGYGGYSPMVAKTKKVK